MWHKDSYKNNNNYIYANGSVNIQAWQTSTYILKSYPEIKCAYRLRQDSPSKAWSYCGSLNETIIYKNNGCFAHSCSAWVLLLCGANAISSEIKLSQKIYWVFLWNDNIFYYVFSLRFRVVCTICEHNRCRYVFDCEYECLFLVKYNSLRQWQFRRIVQCNRCSLTILFPWIRTRLTATTCVLLTAKRSSNFYWKRLKLYEKQWIYAFQRSF